MKLRFVFLSIALLYSASRGHCQNQKEFDVDRLVHKMTEVSGGDSAIAAINTHTSKFVITPLRMEDTKEIVFVTYKRPDKIRFDEFNADGSLIYSQFTDGKEAWVYRPGEGVMPIHQKKTEELISWAEHWIDEWRIYQEIGLNIEYVDDVKIGERACYKMRITDKFGIESYWFVDSNTHLMARIVHSIIEPFSGELTGSVVEDFVEYHDVGVIFPTKLMDNSSTHEMTQWVMNHTLSDSLFDMTQTNVVANGQYLQRVAEEGAYVKPSKLHQSLKTSF